jgi:hypothetical protein
MMLKLDNTDRLVDIETDHELGRFQSAGAITNDGLTHTHLLFVILLSQ